MRNLVSAFLAAGAPLVVAADETLERRRGPKIHALGCFRDPVRSTKKINEHFLKNVGIKTAKSWMFERFVGRKEEGPICRTEEFN